MNSSSPSTSLTLLDQLRVPGRTEAWARFDRLYRPLLHTWATRQGFQDADAADLAQEVLVKLMAELPQYTRGEGQSFRGWLFRVTANVGHEIRRRVATRKLPGAAGLSSANAEPPLVEFEEAEYRKALIDSGLAAIKDEFEEKTLAAFKQLMIENRESEEVAAELGMTKAAAYIAKSRVLKRLREVISDFLE